ncbi:tyrosine-type recombinase/integrase [Antribacter sp. KLBMP9083]|uniref:Tyrosine-type recombinase/integrase n=1 Tax=Antribacter soli TaxID=2910976 RepID=A0AA41U7U0_9MICO|nr:tyrosine-type recombinase/integrase [Antribacter soli]MCF4121740.1 tyrosine-type recombinase/integrase [Antribacter soli]
MGTTTEKRQRREAWGSLRKLPSKRWQARYPGPDGTVYSARTEDDKPLTFLTKGDARAWLNRMHDRIARGEWLPPEEAARRRRAEAESAAIRDVTFREYAEQWLVRIAHEPGKGGKPRRPATVLAYRGRVNNYLMEPLGDVRVRDIDTTRVGALTARLVALPSVLKPGAKHNGVAGDAVDTLKMILRAAVRDGILTAMPGVPTPARKSVRHDDGHTPEDDVATPSQVDALYTAVQEPWRIAVLLAAWCQLRRGEVLGLQRRDIVWDAERKAATLYVRRQKNGTTGKLADPKSDMGVRSMAVPPHMIDRLREHLEGRVASGPTAPVVPTEARGRQHLSATRWNAVWSEARKAVDGLPDGYRFHDLRHTGLTRFAQEGATLAELMRRGGHADVNVVLRYQKATMQRDIDLAARMSATVEEELRRDGVKSA